MAIEVDFSYSRSTKRTYVYKENAAEGMDQIGVLYVKKTTLGEKPPEEIRITLEAL